MTLSVAVMLPTAGSATQPPASAAPATRPVAQKHRAKAKPAAAPEVPQTPAPPPTLEEQPPTPPQVLYKDGQLSITSVNATLAQVLRSVQTQTGASIEIPANAGNERVAASLGPGKPQSVLASLLNGCKFNYVILGVPDKPNAVQKVILLAKTTTAGDAGSKNAYQPPAQQQPPTEQPEDEYPQAEPENQLQPGMPGMPGSENLQPDAVQPGNRTPEQMLQDLQRMQQQQQQMQQQLNPSNQQQQPFGQPFVMPNQPPNPSGSPLQPNAPD